MHACKQAISEHKLLAASVVCIFLLAACHKDAGVATAATQSAAIAPITHQPYILSRLPDLHRGAVDLSASVDAFLKNPEQVNLEQARNSWLALHHTLVSLEVYCNRPYRDETIRQLWFDLDAWPLEPGFIDSIPDYPDSGIINDLALPMTAVALRSQHGATSLTEISTGMHAVEYLLWQRPLEDYEPINQPGKAELESGIGVDQLSNNRRREMLRLVVKLIGEDLTALQQLLTDSLNNGAQKNLAEPWLMAHLDLLAIQRTLLEAQQNSTELHSFYSQSWPADVLSLLQQVDFLVGQQFAQLPPNTDDSIRQSLSEAIMLLSELDVSNTEQLSDALALVIKLDLQLDTLFDLTRD